MFNPHTLASDGLVSYVGDIHPLSYGGTWIDSSTWTNDGYASAVRVNVLDDGPDAGRHIIIEKLTINKPKGMGPALECCGVTGDNLSPIVEAECCLSYGHYDPDESDYREPSSYSFIIPDDGEEPADFAKYAKIHGATIVTEEDIEKLLYRLVGCELYCGR